MITLITFSSALLVFVAILTGVYLAILLFDKRLKGFEWRPKAGIANFALFGVCGLMILLLVFQRLWNTSVLYFLLYPTTVFLLVIALIYSSASKRSYLLVMVVLLHLIVLNIVFPLSGALLTERTTAIVALDKAKTWNPKLSELNSYYNPFPLDVGLLYDFSKISSIMYTDALGVWVISLLFIIAYDLILFSFAKDVSGRWKVGVLAVLLIMFSPPLALNPQPQWLANLFIMVFLLGLFRALKGSPSFSNVVAINLSYGVAILLHGTAAIGAVVVSILVMLMLFGRSLGINITTTARHRSVVYLTALSVYVLTLCRWVILGGINSVMEPLTSLVNSILSRVLNKGAVSTFSNYVPLYNQFVSPIDAYAWSIPISLTFAFLLYHLVNRAKRKSLNVVFLSSLGLAGGTMAFSGFLGSMLTAADNLQRYLGYAGMSLLIPVAAIAFGRILRSSSWRIITLGLISIVLFCAIGIRDPAFSPQLYPQIQTVSATRSEDLIEGNTLYSILPEVKYVVSTYEISYAIKYLSNASELSNKTINFYAVTLKTNRDMVENLTVEKEAQSGIVYIWTPEILDAATGAPLNVVYDSGRHVAVESGNP